MRVLIFIPQTRFVRRPGAEIPRFDEETIRNQDTISPFSSPLLLSPLLSPSQTALKQAPPPLKKIQNKHTSASPPHTAPPSSP